MSTITSATTAQTQQQQSQTSATPQQEIGEEFTAFIKLLTAQVQNQDPLSPMDSTQFVEQLATFSNLEQQVRSNKSLESIATMIGDMHAMFASEWLGQKVTVESSWVPYSGDAVEYSFDAPDGADRAVLTVRDSSGEAIWSEALDIDAEEQSWDGDTESGVPAAGGTIYQFGIDLFDGDTYLGTVAPRVMTTVTDVANESGTLMLGTSSHLTTDLAGVRKVSE